MVWRLTNIIDMPGGDNSTGAAPRPLHLVARAQTGDPDPRIASNENTYKSGIVKANRVFGKDRFAGLKRALPDVRLWQW